MKKVFNIFCIIFGIIVFMYPNICEWSMEYRTEKTIEKFVKEVVEDVNEADKVTPKKEKDSKNEEKDESEDKFVAKDNLYYQMKDYNDSLLKSGQQIFDAWTYAQSPMGIGLIGYIEIPDMNLKMPLYIGASKENMAIGATVLGGTSMPIGGVDNNCVIAGHRGYSGANYFKEIEKLKKGSVVYVTNPWGKMVYRVTGFTIIEPNDSEAIKIQPGKDMVTLLTCHPYMGNGRWRYVVFCERGTDITGSEKEQLEDLRMKDERENLKTSFKHIVNIIKNPDDPKSFQDFSNTLILLEKIIRFFVFAALIIFGLKPEKKKTKRPIT